MENNIAILDSKATEIKQLFAPSLTQIEFDYFIGLAKSLNANPFKKEIYAIKYKEQLSVFCGRDLYRRVAQEQPDYQRHNTSVVYENDLFEITNGVVIHKFSLKNRGAIVGAYASLWKKGDSTPFTKFVYFREYDKKFGNWSFMPCTMIEKVAESQVLRMAYQGIFSGTYEESEKWQENENNTNKTIDIENENTNEPPPLPPFTYSLEKLCDALQNKKSEWTAYKDKFVFSDTQKDALRPILKELGYVM